MNLVEPSIDTRLYNPFIIKSKRLYDVITLCAMIRPSTVRRNPIGTMNVCSLLKEKYKSKINIVVFGCKNEEIYEIGEYNFEYMNMGILKRIEVASLLVASDLFLDMSTYQAFGRTGLESMCLGCVPILPKEGGANKYAINNFNSIIIDTRDDNDVFYNICKLIDTPEIIGVLQKNCLETAKKYNIINACWSEIELFNNIKSDTTRKAGGLDL